MSLTVTVELAAEFRKYFAAMAHLIFFGHADFGVDGSKHLDVCCRRILDTLVRVVNLRRMVGQRTVHIHALNSTDVAFRYPGEPDFLQR